MSENVLDLIDDLEELIAAAKEKDAGKDRVQGLYNRIATLEGHLKRLHPELCSDCWLRPKHPAGPTCVECIPF